MVSRDACAPVKCAGGVAILIIEWLDGACRSVPPRGRNRFATDSPLPLLHISCESEGPLVMTAGHEFNKKLTCPKAEHVVRSVDGGEAHCKIEFDWLDGVFK